MPDSVRWLVWNLHVLCFSSSFSAYCAVASGMCRCKTNGFQDLPCYRGTSSREMDRFIDHDDF